jgi:NADH-quinone oxidoreductase subunit G
MGPVPYEGQDDEFPKHAEGNGKSGSTVKFRILSEKCPNRRGIEMVLESLGGATGKFEDFTKKAGTKAFSAAWIVGGYPKPWVNDELKKVLGLIRTVFAQDMFENEVTAAATVIVPSCSWAERSGSFVNAQDKIQPFDAAINPLEGCQRDGNYLYAMYGGAGLYNAARVRELMAKKLPAFATVHVPPEPPKFAH